MRRHIRWAVPTLTALAVGIGMAPAASAHDWLVSSNPAKDSTVSSAPKNISLTFDDLVLDKPAAPRVTVTGPDGKHYETTCATAAGRDVTLGWQPGGPGKYDVSWRIVSADGHPVSDHISLTYSGPKTSATGAASPRNCDAAAAASASSPAGPSSGQAAPARGENKTTSGSSAPMIFAGIAAVVALALIGLIAARSRRCPSKFADEADE